MAPLPMAPMSLEAPAFIFLSPIALLSFDFFLSSSAGFASTEASFVGADQLAKNCPNGDAGPGVPIDWTGAGAGEKAGPAVGAPADIGAGNPPSAIFWTSPPAAKAAA